MMRKYEIPKKMMYLNCDLANPSKNQQYFARLLLDFRQKRNKCTRYGDRRVMQAYGEVNRN